MCSTEVDTAGFGKVYNWGWCDEDCPLEGSHTTWATDDTLTVTTHFKNIDPDVYKAMIALGIVAVSLVIIAVGLKCLGIRMNLNIIFIYSSNIF